MNQEHALFERIGASADLPDHARLECGICWTVYDPTVGDPIGRIPPGTPFGRLPEHWTCPECDAPRHKFMRLADD